MTTTAESTSRDTLASLTLTQVEAIADILGLDGARLAISVAEAMEAHQ